MANCATQQHQLLTPEYAYLTDVRHQRANGDWKALAHGVDGDPLKRSVWSRHLDVVDDEHCHR